VPVLDGRGATVAAIGISTPAERWRTQERGLTELCCEIGVRASNALRGDPGREGAVTAR
jgi:hypothetical protein